MSKRIEELEKELAEKEFLDILKKLKEINELGNKNE